MELLRFLTCGSVDDGKSTLIGRLLYDSKTLLRDQVAALERSSAKAGMGLNLALLTDGLRAEREQGITIDVAYKYFATPRREFIIADTPGHVQYTRNMVTGASTADLAVLLVDARQGLLEQTRRHAYLAGLLRIPHVVLAVNKMDAVDWSQTVYQGIRDQFMDLTRASGFADVHAIPVSALLGDNVVDPSTHTPYYEGPPLLRYLEEIVVDRPSDPARGRLPVQLVLRPSDPALQDYRAYAGQMTAGVFRPGDEVVVLPSNIRSAIVGIDRGGRPIDEAFAPMSVAIRLRDDVDVGRGEVIASVKRPPRVGQQLRARLCWMAERPLLPRARLLVRHATATVPGMVTAIESVVSIHTFADQPGPAQLDLNEIGVVHIKTARPLAFDAYAEERTTGAFVLVNETSNGTVAAGLITAEESQP
jgi:sulfate adenylyltransferase large subunit